MKVKVGDIFKIKYPYGTIIYKVYRIIHAINRYANHKVECIKLVNYDKCSYCFFISYKIEKQGVCIIIPHNAIEVYKLSKLKSILYEDILDKK